MALWTVICFKIPVALRCRDLSVSAKKEKPEEKERGETEMRQRERRDKGWSRISKEIGRRELPGTNGKDVV